MSSTNKTPNLELNQWVLTDPFLMEDMNSDNGKIDAAVNSRALVKLAHIETTASCLVISLDVRGIDWSEYREVYIEYSLKHGAAASTYVYSIVRGNGRYGSSDYYTRMLDTNGIAARTEASYFFTGNDMNCGDGQPCRHKIRIFTDGGCTLFQENRSFNDMNIVYGGVLRTSTSSAIPLPLSQLTTLDFSCAYGAGTGLTDPVYLLAGSKFDIYGVK
ncbi:MAG: hypothetical protein QMB62_06115 [Oscillospiraceae bacterium]